MALSFAGYRIRRFAAAAVLAAATASARAELAVFELRTDYLPAEEFAGVKLRFASMSDPGSVFVAEHTAFTDQDYLGFERIAEIEAPLGDYELTVDLLDGDGDVVARSSILVDFDVSRFISVVMAKPSGNATKSVALQVDADGDGAISGGDVVRYTVAASGIVGRSFTDELSPELALIAGSVTTSHGLVLEGNSPGDTRVVIVDMGFGDSTPAVVEFDARVLPEIANQGEVLFETGTLPPGPFGGQYASLRVRTDDPATPEPGDPTRAPVACGASAACEDDLDACEADLDGCAAVLAECVADRAALEAEVADLEGTLAGILDDADGDSVPAIADDCPGSAPGAPVDAQGCSLAEFCGAIDLDAPQGVARCRNADWGNDEPLGDPGDCRRSGDLCLPD